jgi:hypothetical protein
MSLTAELLLVGGRAAPLIHTACPPPQTGSTESEGKPVGMSPRKGALRRTGCWATQELRGHLPPTGACCSGELRLQRSLSPGGSARTARPTMGRSRALGQARTSCFDLGRIWREYGALRSLMTRYGHREAPTGKRTLLVSREAFHKSRSFRQMAQPCAKPRFHGVFARPSPDGREAHTGFEPVPPP